MLGLFGFAVANFMVATNLAGWYGGTEPSRVLFPFAGRRAAQRSSWQACGPTSI